MGVGRGAIDLDAHRKFEAFGSLERISVVGPTCAGKTTLGKEISRSRNVPFYDLDEINYGPLWTKKAPDEFRKRTAEAASGPLWVISGKYSVVQDLIWNRASGVVWINLGFWTTFFRLLRRTYTRLVGGEVVFHGNKESVFRLLFSRNSVILWSIISYWVRRREFRSIMNGDSLPNLVWIELRTPREVDEFVLFIKSCLALYDLSI